MYCKLNEPTEKGNYVIFQGVFHIINDFTFLEKKTPKIWFAMSNTNCTVQKTNEQEDDILSKLNLTLTVA